MTEQERAAASAEHYRRMRAELDRRLSLDPELRQLSKKIRSGKADFQDTFRYSEIVSNHIGRIMQENVGTITNPLGKQYVCEALLKDHYKAINDVLGEVQVQIDEKLDIHLNPVKPPCPIERIVQVAHALEDPTVKPEVIKRRAKAPVVNVSMSFHDDYIKENARIRAKLGFKCYLNRVAAAGCCKWCTDIAGRYVYGDQPDDVFHRHDNCGCTVTYEHGRERQDVWSKRTWQASPLEVMRNGFQPARNSPAQAAKINENAQDGLTLAGERDIIRAADSGSIYHEITKESIERVPLLEVFGDEQKNRRYQEANKALLREAQKYEPGVEVSRVYDADMRPIEGFEYRVGSVGGSTISYPGVPFHGFHNHGSDETFSLTDLIGFASADDMLSVTATGNRGSIYLVKRTKSSDSEGYKQFLTDKYTEPFCKIKNTDITIKMTKDKSTWDAFYKGLTASEKEHFMDELTRFGKECAEGGEKYGFKYEYHKT